MRFSLSTTGLHDWNGDVLVVKALERMEHNRRKPISVLPVVGEQKRLLGLLRLHDLVQAGLA